MAHENPPTGRQDAGTTRWTADAVRRQSGRPDLVLPLIGDGDDVVVVPDLDVWDMWHLQRLDGTTAIIDGLSWWFFLAAEKFDDPEARHDHARIRLLTHGGEGWADRGYLLPGTLAPGSREWSGSTVLHEDGETVTLYFTAAGRREGGPRFEQRLFSTTGKLDVPARRIREWSSPGEIVAADGSLYAVADEEAPTNGMIRGFRDPSHFRDPADGAEYVVFTGTAACGVDPFDGVIGAARRIDGEWRLLPPLIDAVGVNKELERAHIVCKDGLYYLFWSTHGVRFAPGLTGRSGLYGMVADTMAGPWRPLNGSGLVAGNPDDQPQQAYCWLVTDERDVLSFVNYPRLGARSPAADPALARATFGGTVAPMFRLSLDGDVTTFEMTDTLSV